jgi:hypothetical protein
MTRSTTMWIFSLPSTPDIANGFSYTEPLEGVQQLYGVFVLTKFRNVSRAEYRSEYEVDTLDDIMTLCHSKPERSTVWVTERPQSGRNYEDHISNQRDATFCALYWLQQTKLVEINVLTVLKDRQYTLNVTLKCFRVTIILVHKK